MLAWRAVIVGGLALATVGVARPVSGGEGHMTE